MKKKMIGALVHVTMLALMVIGYWLTPNDFQFSFRNNLPIVMFMLAAMIEGIWFGYEFAQ